ncbi:DNA-3-methyladenine glycosylase [Kocuria sp. SM24M-10]|uniref:DNA-3-methyladenine glycosylase family protein n=1 Tax=Kocuria sp. SM24M-10 TaxID=1660349 RepID=UPI00069C28FC|nr:AlkA N-terminal domain-containing protein [Kocuria sp. SM24M-10]
MTGPDGGPGGTVEVLLPPPTSARFLRDFLASQAVPGCDDLAGGAHRRPVVVDGVARTVTVGWDRLTPAGLPVRVGPGAEDALEPVLRRVRRWLGDGTESPAADRALASDAALAPAVRAWPLIRLPGSPDGFETAVLTVLGQQVSLAAARTFAGRLLRHYGSPAADGLTAFPSARRIAAADPSRLRQDLGVTTRRAATIHALAAAVCDGLDLEPPAAAGGAGAARDAARWHRHLLALPGIGPWTAGSVALRVLGEPDVFLPQDLVLRRALGVAGTAAAAERSAGWSPWRSYAVMLLWARAAFPDSAAPPLPAAGPG